MTIAQQFTAGEMGNPGVPSPVGTAESYREARFQPSLRDEQVLFFPFAPAINRWAIVNRPYGSKWLRLV